MLANGREHSTHCSAFDLGIHLDKRRPGEQRPPSPEIVLHGRVVLDALLIALVRLTCLVLDDLDKPSRIVHVG